MELIARGVLSATGVIEFTSIPDTFEEIYLVGRISNSSGADLAFTFNNSSANFINVQMETDTSNTFYRTARTDNYHGIMHRNGTDIALNFASFSLWIPNYKNSGPKDYLVRSDRSYTSTANGETLTSGRWSGTGAITSIELDMWLAQELVANSAVSLYGISYGSDGTTTVS